MLCIVAAAIVIPLEFFVFKNLGNQDEPRSEMAQCQASLTCQNGGTNIVSKGACSCICTNGFTGSDCSADGTEGCTTTSLTSTDGETNLSNVTLGKAIPRLLADSNANFSIPLSGTALLALFNKDDLSCIAQNSLVTFEGRSLRVGTASSKADGSDQTLEAAAPINNAAYIPISVITIDPNIDTTITIDLGAQPSTSVPAQTSVSTTTSEPITTQTSTTSSSTLESSASTTRTTSRRSTPSDAFTVVEETLDFARVSVLYILQEEGQDEAEEAQTALQRFFTDAGSDEGVTTDEASNLSIGGNSTINLEQFTLNIGSGAIGGSSSSSNSKRGVPSLTKLVTTSRKALHLGRHGGSVFSKDQM